MCLGPDLAAPDCLPRSDTTEFGELRAGSSRTGLKRGSLVSTVVQEPHRSGSLKDGGPPAPRVGEMVVVPPGTRVRCSSESPIGSKGAPFDVPSGRVRQGAIGGSPGAEKSVPPPPARTVPSPLPWATDSVIWDVSSFPVKIPGGPLAACSSCGGTDAAPVGVQSSTWDLVLQLSPERPVRSGVGRTGGLLTSGRVRG